MLRKTLVATLALALSATAVGAQANEGATLGVGILLNPIALGDLDSDLGVLPIGLGNFTVPIRVGERFRIEPELGILRASSEASGGGFSGEFSQTVLRYGLAAHFMMGGSGPFRSYVGPRVGFVRSTNKQQSSGSPDYEEKRTDNYFGVVVGGEYWFTPRFSLGAELQINRVSLGDEEVTGQPGSTTDYSASFISNNGVIAAKFYLF